MAASEQDYSGMASNIWLLCHLAAQSGTNGGTCCYLDFTRRAYRAGREVCEGACGLLPAACLPELNMHLPANPRSRGLCLVGIYSRQSSYIQLNKRHSQTQCKLPPVLFGSG